MKESENYLFEKLVNNPEMFCRDVSGFGKTSRYFEKPYVNKGFLVAICTEGVGKIEVNFKEYLFSENHVLVVLPFSSVESGCRSTDFKAKVLYFSQKIVSKNDYLFNEYNFISKNMESVCREISKIEVKDLIDFYSFFSKQLKNIDKDFKTHFSEVAFKSFLVKIKSIYHQDNLGEIPKNMDRLADNFARLLMENYKTEHNVGFYADKLCLTPKYLSFVIKKISGKSASFWIKKVILSDAKFRLKTTNNTISQISDELNFSTASEFGRFFKQNEGVSPFKYRDSIISPSLKNL